MRVFVLTDLEGAAGVASFERDAYPGARASSRRGRCSRPR